MIVGLGIAANVVLNFAIGDHIRVSVARPKDVLFVCAVRFELQLADEGLAASNAQREADGAHHDCKVVWIGEASG